MSWWHRACTYFCRANVSFSRHNSTNSPNVKKGHDGLSVSVWQQPKCKNAYPCMWTLQITLDFFLQVPVSQRKPGAPRRQDREHHRGNTACLGREIIPPTHTHCLSNLCGVMCKRFWLDYTERLLSGTRRIDYRQECERDWIVCSATGDAFWHCDSLMTGICSRAAQMRTLKKAICFLVFHSTDLHLSPCSYDRNRDCRPKRSTSELKTAFTGSVSAVCVYENESTGTSWSD